MLFIKNWNKASLDKSSNSIVTRYKSKINLLTDKTDALRKLLGELYDEAITLNERIKIDKQAIQEDLNDTADDLRTTCGNSSWGQDEIKKVQGILDKAEEDIEDVKTDIEITTGCLVVCQSGQGTNCGQPCSQSCNESTCLIGNVPCNDTPSETPEEPEEEDCVVIVNGEFECTEADSYIDECYGGCFGNQSCDSQTKVCPKCHGSEIDIVETCDNCDTDQKETCGTFDSQEGCDTNNETGNCNTDNKTGDCETDNLTGDCGAYNSTGNCRSDNETGSCGVDVEGNCGTTNNAENVDKPECERWNSKDTDCDTKNRNGDCVDFNSNGDCNRNNSSGDCVRNNNEGTCQVNDKDSYCYEQNSGDQETCARKDNADRCTGDNNNGDCNGDNNVGDCYSNNNVGKCYYLNKSGDCYSENDTGNCIRDNLTGECDTQSCEAGQECTTCIEDQKETTTTEKCEAGANIGEEEYCDTCQGTESKEEEWTQDELTDLCGSIFEGGADACGPVFASCFNTENCNGSSWGAESGCGSGQGCGTCDTTDSACDAICDSSQDPVCGTCDMGDGGCTGTCYGGDSPSCYPIYTIPGGGECAFGYDPNCGQGSVCPMCFTASIDCGQGGCDDSAPCDDGPDIDLD